MNEILIDRFIATLDNLKKTLQELKGDTEPELKPCPFCGGEDFVMDDPINVAPYCQGCGAVGPPWATKEEAIEAWNRRV